MTHGPGGVLWTRQRRRSDVVSFSSRQAKSVIVMGKGTNPQWNRHLEGIADELLRLAIACDVRLRDPGVIERIIRNDATVCGRKNPRGFEKLRKLLMAAYDSLGKAIERIGPEETKMIADAIAEYGSRRRDSGGFPDEGGE